MSDLLTQLADRLEHHLSQLCDEKHCVTPDHVETRALIKLARERLYVRVYPTAITSLAYGGKRSDD